MSKEAIKLLEKVVEALYQKVEGFCPWCGAKDYPVLGEKQGYEEVKAEDAEEWHIDHCEDCIVVYLDKALAILKKPKCDTCGDTGKVPANDSKNAGHIPDKDTIAVIPCPDCQQRKDLLEACNVGLGIAKWTRDVRNIPELLKKDIELIEAAITKAEKEG